MKETGQQQQPLTELIAITPLDGRYHTMTEELSPFVSEYGLIRTRMDVEARYLMALSDIGVVRPLTPPERKKLTSFGEELSLEDAGEVKKIEDEIKHDVKAMERAFRNMLGGTSLSDVVEKVHIGLTSEDINNIAYRLMLQRATSSAVVPRLEEIVLWLTDQAEENKAIPMLGRTHGQAAVPTTLGKEMAVFAGRLSAEVVNLKDRKLTGKFSGAVGNFNALRLTYPEIDWENFSRKFIKSFGLVPNMTTTQINSYEDMSAYFQNYLRINGILIDFDQDMWRYISDHWIVQKPKKGEVGSSTMPQKVNPIFFENSEGNLGLSNAIFEYFSRKLPVSRLQRDLSDSTVIRNIGTSLGFSLVAYKNLIVALGRVSPDLETIAKALDSDWTILAEGVQTLLREAGVNDPYSLVSDLIRGKHIGKEEWKEWAEGLPIDDGQKVRIKNLTPQTYIGDSVRITEETVKQIKSTFKPKTK